MCIRGKAEADWVFSVVQNIQGKVHITLLYQHSSASLLIFNQLLEHQ